MIISVDTGNKHMKTENCEFNSGVEILDTLPGELEEVIEYEGKYYMTTNRRISYMEDKTADDRYYILTLFAIAKELSYREKNEGLLPQNLQEIELLVGLPPAHYGKQRKKFREYFYRNGAVVEFCYKGISYRIVFKEVKVYIQAYAAYCLLAVKKQLSVIPKILLIDIGGFTVDYMVLRFGQLEMEYVDSLENGVIRLYNSIKAAIRQKYSILLDEEDIDNIILERGGCYKPELKERVREVAIGYVTELLGKFRELGIDFNTTQTVFLGGGSILLADFIQIVWKRFGVEYNIILKKEPFTRYVKETGRKPYIGITQDESFRREHQYSKTGCNVYSGALIKSQPLGSWTRADVLRYIVEKDIEISSVYGDILQDEFGQYYTTGEQRTGCMFCGFGAHLEAEPNRFQRMLVTHPKHYKICMNLTNNGVRYEEALNACGIPTKTWEQAGQLSLDLKNAA